MPLHRFALTFIPAILFSANACAQAAKQPTAKYVIKQHTVVPSKGLPPEDFYTIEYGSVVFKVKYHGSQTSSAKPGDFPGSGLHWHNQFNPDVSQVPDVGVPIRACTFNKDRDTDGDLVIAHQSTDAPCMARIGNTLQYEPSPNGPVLFTYVAFDILSEKSR
jgi:hypothetical protein